MDVRPPHLPLNALDLLPTILLGLLMVYVVVRIFIAITRRSDHGLPDAQQAREAPSATEADPTPAAPGAVVAGARAGQRCPYCHADAVGDDAVACAACMARHHEGCWDEHGECAACRSRERFRGLERTDGHTGREAPGRDGGLKA